MTSYALDESHDSRNYTPESLVPTAFGYPRQIKWITIHHWGNKGQNFDVVRDYLCTNTTPTSAHYVAMDGRVACIVSEPDAAWHAGNAQGNAQSIGIECRPEATDGDYTTIAALIRDIRSRWGDIPLVPHSYWTQTACPGDYDLARLDRMARTETKPATKPQGNKPATIQEDTLSAAEVTEIKEYIHALLIGGYTTEGQKKPGLSKVVSENQRRLDALPAAVWATPVRRGSKPVAALQELADIKTKVMGLEPVIADIAAQTDPAQIAALIPADIAGQVIEALSAKLGAK